MKDAEAALRKAMLKLPEDFIGKVIASDKLEDADRKEIITMATKALEPFSKEKKATAGS